jgi:SPX domain protein involved in polyphosphate accumulation
MKTNNERISDYRYERKFFITELSKYEVEYIVKLHTAIFSEIYHKRFVNNIYFDSFNLVNYRENIEGATDRIKIRIRWYGELFGYIEKPVLEIKIKKELLNKKISIPIKPFVLKKDTIISDILNSFTDLQDSLVIDFNSIQPSLLNQYSRKYYQSCNGQFRITIDTDQSFYQVNNQNNLFLNRTSDNNTVILELKYDKEHDSEARHITTKFPFRITKSSKYVNGVEKILQVAF